MAKRSLIALLLTAGLLGIGLGCGAASACQMNAASFEIDGSEELVLELRNDTKASASGEAAFAYVRIGDVPVAVQAVFSDGEARLCGDTVKAAGSFREADWRKDGYLWQNNAIGTFTITGAESVTDDSPIAFLRALRKSAIQNMGTAGEAPALAKALACGYRRDIEQTSAYASFQRAGLAHLVAVSGAHLVILTGLVAAIVNAAGVPRRLSIALLVAIMGAYLVMSGVPISAVRATIMSSIGVLALLGKRRPSSQNALGLGIVAIVCSNPAASVSVSFVLSVLSTAGIVLFSQLIGTWLSRTPIRHAKMAKDALALTFSANILSQLYACSVFHQLPLIAPMANVLTAPVFPFACAGALAIAVISAIAGVLPMPITCIMLIPAMVLDAAVSAISSLPFASIPASVSTEFAIGSTIALGCAFWLAWPTGNLRRAFPAIVSLLVALIVHAASLYGEDSIIMLDVGQGDAFLVRSKGATMLIDTGNHDSQLIEQLGRSGTFKVDSVLITHQDEDHCGSLDALQRVVTVDRVLMMSDALSSDSAKNAAVVEQAQRTAGEVVGVRAGDAFEVGSYTGYVVWPDEYRDDGGNADSVCVLFEYDGDNDGAVDAKALFAGDVESEQIDAILRSGHIGDVDLLKVGHHGSKAAFNQRQIEILDPEIALIGVGENNRYGHPSQEALGMLESVGCKVYRSDLDGQVKCTFTPESIRVSLQ
ncbi:MAG: DNA internalization-related competence protein ComEC/Rec2 [Eggerthellaceae bacterium]|nr:DNA internalization-related competence protein ComEC/Rec2 [Eggerthellaceae bacterium]